MDIEYKDIAKDYIVNSMANYGNLFINPVDVIEHMLCVNGNGVNASTFGPEKEAIIDTCGGPVVYKYGGATLNAGFIAGLKVTPLKSLYGWSNKKRYQPFREYLDIEIPENYEGMRECVRYFLKCLDVTTEEGISNPKSSTETAYYVKSLRDWKANAHVLREVFDL